MDDYFQWAEKHNKPAKRAQEEPAPPDAPMGVQEAAFGEGTFRRLLSERERRLLGAAESDKKP